MAQEKFAVRLSAEDRGRLERSIRSGQRSARVINRARILLKTDEGWSASQAASALDTSQRTVFRTKRRYGAEGLDGVLHDHPQANRYRKLDDRSEAHLIVRACSDAPAGHDHWTLRRLADKVVELGVARSLSHETVRLRLKKHPQAVAEAAVAQLPAERGVRGGDGGRAGPLRRALRPQPAGNLFRRDFHPTAGRCAGTAAHPGGTTQAGRPRRDDPGGTTQAGRPRRNAPGGRTTSIDAVAPATSSCSANRWLAGATSPSRSGAPGRTALTRCAGWWTWPTPTPP